VLVFPLADGPISGAHIWLDDGPADDHKAEAKITIRSHKGSYDQQADTILANNDALAWDSTRRGVGVAYTILEMDYDREAFSAGLPKFSAVIEGALLWNPRDESAEISGSHATNIIQTTSQHNFEVGDFVWLSGSDHWGKYQIVDVVSETELKLISQNGEFIAPNAGQLTPMVWSDNAALVILDIVLRVAARFASWGVVSRMIDLDSFKRAADICDELVDLGGGKSHARYTINGAVTSEQRPGAILQEMLKCCAGLIVRRGGRVALIAGGTIDTVGDLTADDLTDNISFTRGLAHSQLFNAVGGTITDEAQNWLATTTPLTTNRAYEAEDGGRIRYRLDHRFVTDSVRAQRLQKIALERHRQQLVITWPAPPSKAWITIGDVVNVTLAQQGWQSKPFQVMATDITEAGNINFDLAEWTDAVFQWNEGEASTSDLAPDFSDHDPSAVAVPTGFTLIAGDDEVQHYSDGTTIPRALARWDEVTNPFTQNIEIEYRINSAPWQSVVLDPQITRHYFSPLKDEDAIEARIRAVNVFGARSEWSEIAGAIVPADVGAPSPPSQVIVQSIHISTITIFISGVADRDLSHFEIRYKVAQIGNIPAMIISESEWASASELEVKAAPPVKAGQAWRGDYTIPATGTYRLYVRAVDRTGNISIISQAASAVVDFIDRSGTVAEQRAGVNAQNLWDGVLLEGFDISDEGVLLPATSQTMSESVAHQDSDNMADWPERLNHQRGWLFSPSHAGTAQITLPILEFGLTLDGVIRSQYALFYPPDSTVTAQNFISRELRVRLNNSWSDWAVVEAVAPICADAVQFRLSVMADRDAPRSFGIESLAIQMSVVPIFTAPAIVEVTDAQAGVQISFSQPYITTPLLIAEVIEVSGGAPDNYEVRGFNSLSKTGVTLSIVRKNRNQRATGKIIWETRGLG